MTVSWSLTTCLMPCWSFTLQPHVIPITTGRIISCPIEKSEVTSEAKDIQQQVARIWTWIDLSLSPLPFLSLLGRREVTSWKTQPALLHIPPPPHPLLSLSSFLHWLQNTPILLSLFPPLRFPWLIITIMGSSLQDCLWDLSDPAQGYSQLKLTLSPAL